MRNNYTAEAEKLYAKQGIVALSGSGSDENDWERLVYGSDGSTITGKRPSFSQRKM
jgi:hypothetical protein